MSHTRTNQGYPKRRSASVLGDPVLSYLVQRNIYGIGINFHVSNIHYQPLDWELFVLLLHLLYHDCGKVYAYLISKAKFQKICRKTLLIPLDVSISNTGAPLYRANTDSYRHCLRILDVAGVGRTWWNSAGVDQRKGEAG